MKNFLLTVFGNFEKEDMCNEMAIALSPVVDSPFLKFSYSKSVLLFHFATEVSKEEIYDFIIGLSYGVSNGFVLTEVNDKMTAHFPERVMEHLFNLSHNTIESVELDMSKVRDNFGFDDMEDEENFMALILNTTNTKIKKPTLNEILDKMIAKGQESLTEYERDLLNYYSKS